MEAHEIRVLVGVEENPHLQKYKERMKRAGVTYHLFDSDPKRTPIAFIFNGESEPTTIEGLANIEKAIESILNNP